jgi:hypothetical protein
LCMTPPKTASGSFCNNSNWNEASLTYNTAQSSGLCFALSGASTLNNTTNATNP